MELKLLFTLAVIFLSSESSAYRENSISAQQTPIECVKGKYPPPSTTKVPGYVINLDLPPQDRWNDVAKDKGAGIKHLLEVFKDLIRGFASNSSASFIIDVIDDDLDIVIDTMPEPFQTEMRGMATAAGMPVGEVFLYNIFYELFTVCTSIIAEDPSGKLFHGRNLDFGIFMGWDVKTHDWAITEALRPLIINLDFQKAGKTVFKTVNFAGYIGVITGIKPGVFTLSVNERFNLDGGYIGVLKWLMGDRSIQWMSFLTRNTLETANSFTEAKTILTQTKMMAPCYFIIGGNKTGEASIITRGREKAEDIWDLGTRNATWYLLETNYDNWKQPPFFDNRRDPGNQCMTELTQKGVSFAGVFNVLSSKPMLNKLTTYTALMQVNSGQLESYIQKCVEPCSPW